MSRSLDFDRVYRVARLGMDAARAWGAYEFLADCVDLLHEELLEAAKADARDEVTPPLGHGPGAPPIAEASLPCALSFSCEVRHELTCLRCGHQWSRPEMTRDFSLELPTPPAVQHASIDTLLRAFFADDELEVGCERCSHPRAKVAPRHPHPHANPNPNPTANPDP